MSLNSIKIYKDGLGCKYLTKVQKRTNQDYKVAPIQRKEKLNISLNHTI